MCNECEQGYNLNQESNQCQQDGLSPGVIAGIVIAILVIVAVITVLVIIIIIIVGRDKEQKVCPEKQVDEKKEKPVDEKQCMQ